MSVWVGLVAAGEKAQGTFEIPPGLDKLADRRAADAIAQGKFGFAMLQFADRSLFLHKYEERQCVVVLDI